VKLGYLGSQPISARVFEFSILFPNGPSVPEEKVDQRLSKKWLMCVHGNISHRAGTKLTSKTLKFCVKLSTFVNGVHYFLPAKYFFLNVKVQIYSFNCQMSCMFSYPHDTPTKSSKMNTQLM
jgi:hypothetical protein